MGLTSAGHHANEKESERLESIQAEFVKSWQYDGANWGLAPKEMASKLMALGAVPYECSIGGEIVMHPANHPTGDEVYGRPVETFNIVWDGKNVWRGGIDEAMVVLLLCYNQMESAGYKNVYYENSFCIFEPTNRQRVEVFPVIEYPFYL